MAKSIQGDANAAAMMLYSSADRHWSPCHIAKAVPLGKTKKMETPCSCYYLIVCWINRLCCVVRSVFTFVRALHFEVSEVPRRVEDMAVDLI